MSAASQSEAGPHPTLGIPPLPLAAEGRSGRRVLPARTAHIPLSFVFLLLAVVPALALNLPALSGRVVDDANILDPATRTALTQKLAELEAKTTDQLVVVTLRSLQGTSIEDFGVELGRGWRIGQQGKNNGVLLIVVPSERKVRMEVGYGLEGTLTDAVSKLIIENAIIPRFRANDIAGGVTRGVDDIISVLTGDAEEWKQRAARRPDPATPWGTILMLMLALGVFALVFVMIVGAMPSHLNNRRRRRSASPWSPESSWWSGSSGGFSSGGGFSDAAPTPSAPRKQRPRAKSFASLHGTRATIAWCRWPGPLPSRSPCPRR